MNDRAQGGVAHHVIAVGIVASVIAVIILALSVPALPAGMINSDDPLRLLNPQLVTRRKAPDFQLPDRLGKIHSLDDYRGRPLVLNFWSIDCPPCLEELPSLTHLAKRGEESRDFSVATVSVDESWEKVSSIFPENLSPPPILFDPSRAVVEGRYGTKLFPETFLIDAQGRIRARFDGARDWMSPAVFEVLRELGGSR